MLNYPAYNNGTWCELKDLNISILDLGFIHSDATYDVLQVRDGLIQKLDAHLDRFERSCQAWRLRKIDRDELTAVLLNLVEKSPTKDLLLWLCVTRGIPKSGNPRDLENCDNRFYAYAKPYFGFNQSNTATVCLARQQRNTSFDQRYKNFAWNDLNLAQWEAIQRGYDTAILLDSENYLTEGPGFNVGIVKNGGSVYAPRINCLAGTTMDLVLKRCSDADIQFFWADIPAEELFEDLEGMFLTSTAGNVIEVTRFETLDIQNNEVVTWLKNAI